MPSLATYGILFPDFQFRIRVKAPKLRNWNFIVYGQIAYLAIVSGRRANYVTHAANDGLAGTATAATFLRWREKEERKRGKGGRGRKSERERKERVQKMTMHYCTRRTMRLKCVALHADWRGTGSPSRDKPAADRLGILSKRLSMTCTRRGLHTKNVPTCAFSGGRSITATYRWHSIYRVSSTANARARMYVYVCDSRVPSCWRPRSDSVSNFIASFLVSTVIALSLPVSVSRWKHVPRIDDNNDGLPDIPRWRIDLRKFIIAIMEVITISFPIR